MWVHHTRMSMPAVQGLTKGGRCEAAAGLALTPLLRGEVSTWQRQSAVCVREGMGSAMQNGPW